MQNVRRELRYWKNKTDLNSFGDGWHKSIYKHTINDPIPFKVRHDTKFKGVANLLTIQKVNSNLIKRLSIHFNRKEYWSVSRRVKSFAVAYHHYGFVFMGILFHETPDIHSIRFNEPIYCNGSKRQTVKFRFPRRAIKLHSYFSNPLLSNAHQVVFFDQMKKVLKDTPYDLLLFDAPVGSNLDRIMRCTPSFLYWKPVRDRRMFFYLDGKQTSFSNLSKLGGVRTYRELFEKFGARLVYNREPIICNRYLTSISNETLLPKANLKNLVLEEPVQYIDPDKIILPEQPKSKILYINPNSTKVQEKYGW